MEDMLNDDSPYCDYSNMEDELYGYLERMIGQSQPQQSIELLKTGGANRYDVEKIDEVKE